MSAMWVIYLAGIVKGLSCFFLMSGLAIGFVSIAVLMNSLDGEARYTTEDKAKQDERNKKVALRFFKQCLVALVAILLAVVIPSKDTVYMMAASKIGQDIISSPETKEISGKVLQLINEKLDEQLAQKDKK